MAWNLKPLTLPDQVTHICINLRKCPSDNFSFGKNVFFYPCNYKMEVLGHFLENKLSVFILWFLLSLLFCCFFFFFFFWCCKEMWRKTCKVGVLAGGGAVYGCAVIFKPATEYRGLYHCL